MNRFLVNNMDNQDFKNFFYPNGTFKNKLGITNAYDLQQVEFRTVARRSIWLLRQNRVTITSIADLQKIHRFLMGPLYSWAGVIRQYDLAKGNTVFLPHAAMRTAIENINEDLRRVKVKPKLTVTEYAELLDKINYLHPFREGNGRSTKLFLKLLGANHNQLVDYAHQSSQVLDDLNDANIQELEKFLIVKDVNYCDYEGE